MINTFKVPSDSKEVIEKKLNSLKKKANRYDCRLEYSFGDTCYVQRNIYEQEFDRTLTLIDDEMVEAVELTIDCDIVKKDGYEPIAYIEHCIDANGNPANIVKTFGEEYDVAWNSIRGNCEHCGTNHARKYTYLVRGHGKTLQVGRACMKDYCGIDPNFIGFSNEVNDLIYGEEGVRSCFSGAARAYNTLEMLALASRIVKKQGYIRSEEPYSNKLMLSKLANDIVSDTELEQASVMAQYILEMNADSSLVVNIQSAIKCGYCTANAFGFIAYAPVMYNKHIERCKKQAEILAKKQEEAGASNYIGSVGERMTVELASMVMLTSWETEFGFVHLYKMVDGSGNVMIWKSSKCVSNFSKVKFTIKGHEERDGVKQTVVTRCVAC